MLNIFKNLIQNGGKVVHSLNSNSRFYQVRMQIIVHTILRLFGLGVVLINPHIFSTNEFKGWFVLRT